MDARPYERQFRLAHFAPTRSNPLSSMHGPVLMVHFPSNCAIFPERLVDPEETMAASSDARPTTIFVDLAVWQAQFAIGANGRFAPASILGAKRPFFSPNLALSKMWQT